MRTTPENPDKAKIRAELKTKPQSKAQCTLLQERFIYEVTQGNIDTAYHALSTLPPKKRDELDKSHFFSDLINQERQDIISNISEHGTKEEKKSLQQQITEHHTYLYPSPIELRI